MDLRVIVAAHCWDHRLKKTGRFASSSETQLETQMITRVHYLGKISVHVRVLARPVARDNTGVHAGVKAGAQAPVPYINWSKGAVTVRDGRDAPQITPEYKEML